MKRVKYAFVSGALSLSVAFGLSSALWTSTAYASTSVPPEVNGWYEVSSASQLEYIDKHQGSFESAKIKLMNDINLSSYSGWVPLGGNQYYASFQGTFSGQGHEITGLTITDNSDLNVGLFGTLTGTIQDLGINITCTSSTNPTGLNVGGLVGEADNGSSISNSYATGSVKYDNAGAFVGGLVGWTLSGSSISNSYATSAVTGGSGTWVGGLVGWNQGSISNSYATGDVTGVGAVVGGFVGANYGNISNSYFDKDTTRQTSSGAQTGVTGETTQAMQTPATFTSPTPGWSTSTWALFNGYYPMLQWQVGSSMSATPTKVLPGGQVTVTGSVHSSGGSPLSGISVTLSDNAGGSWKNSSVTTDSNGKFTDTWTAPSTSTVATLTATYGTSVQKHSTIQVQAFTVTYNGNGNSGGTVPTDSNTYTSASSATVLGNTNNLIKTGYTFAGWNTKADGSGTSYAAGSSLTMPASNVTLYAQWTANPYTVTYKGNGDTAGTAPTDNHTYTIGSSVTVPGNTGSLIKTGYTFAGWNTKADGSGTSYAADSSLTMPASNVTLYAQWTANPYTVTYKGNGDTAGTAPTDNHTYTIGSSVTVPGNTGGLTKTGYTFAGWNTKADGSGTRYAADSSLTMPASNVTLYAQWRVKPAISTSTLPNVLEGTPYNQTFQGAGGVAPYSFSITSGSLPNGLTLQSDGSLAGTPQQGGTFHFTVQIKDHAGTTTTKTMSVYVIPTAPKGYLMTTSTKQVVDNSGDTLTTNSSHTTATLVIAPGTFTKPLQIDITTGTISQSLLPSGWNQIAAYGVNFDATDKPAHPLSFTLLNSSITPRSKVYKVVNDKLIPVTATVSKGKAVISFTTDPDFVVLQPKPVPQATNPVTGFSIYPWASGGLLSILTGGLVLWWKKRKKNLE